jgi:DnaJ-class molecular chaperone
MRDPYQVLGVSRDASAKDIKSAFRRLAKKYHPDQNPDDPKAKDLFAEINQAYEIVGDDDKRGQFDRGEIDAAGKPRFAGFEGAGARDPFGGFSRSGNGPGGMRFEFRSGGPGGADPFSDPDILSEIFGGAFGGGAGPRRPGGARAGGPTGAGPSGADVNVVMHVSLEEVVAAAKVTAQFPDGRKMAVKLPAYVEDGQVIRLKGQGQPSPLGQPGDALVTVRFRQHPRFRVEGRDLHVDVPVEWQDAVLGTKAAVETPAGRVALAIPAWSGSDRKLRLKGRGLSHKTGGHGDLYAHVSVRWPEGGDDELEALAHKARSAREAG